MDEKISGCTVPQNKLCYNIQKCHMSMQQLDLIYRDNPETWLQENMKFPLSSVNAIFPLLWEQGFGVECKEHDWHILMLLQDSQRTQNFLQAAGRFLLFTSKVDDDDDDDDLNNLFATYKIIELPLY